MTSKARRRIVLAGASGLLGMVACTALPASSQEPSDQPPKTDRLLSEFADPPSSARPRVWWHWMNGNITKAGILADLEWMKRVGIAGVQNFDASLDTPQVVDKRLVYMTPEWSDAFRYAVTEAKRREMEFAIASSPGWSETGGPWVLPQDGMKKLVWSETIVEGKRPYSGILPPLPMTTGPFQDMDKPLGIAEMMRGAKPVARPTAGGAAPVIAWEIAGSDRQPAPEIQGPDGEVLDASAIQDADLASSVTLKRAKEGVTALTFNYAQPQTMRSATIYMPGSYIMWIGGLVAPKLEASDDGLTWTPVADMPLGPVPSTVSFPAIRSRHFRVQFVARPVDLAKVINKPAPGLDLSATPYGNLGAGMNIQLPLKVGELRLSSEPRINHWETKAGFALVDDYYALGGHSDAAKGIDPARVVNLTDKVRSDGTLDWVPPRGRWRVLRFGWSLVGTENHPATKEATGLEVDKFDGGAVRRYLDQYLGMYAKVLGEPIGGGRNIDALLTDSIEVGPANWTGDMIAQFTRLRGYDPVPWLPALTGTIVGSRAQSDAFLYDFRRTLADLIASQHYGTLAQVAHEHGLKVYGEALENGRPSLGDDMAMRSHADVPMSALWSYTREEGPRTAQVADVKGAASVAHLYGQNLVASEAMTSSLAYWDQGPAYLKHVIDQNFVLGLNRPVIHTSVHQPVDDKLPGLSLGIFGQYFNRHEAWGELAKPWVDYLSRNAYMLQQGRDVADVAWFYGEEAPLSAMFANKPIPDLPGYNYDFVNADALTNALSNADDEIASKGGARYKVLYLGGSADRMTLPVLRRLAELVTGGATLVGKPPVASPSRGGDGQEYAGLLRKLWPGSNIAQVGKGRVVAIDDLGTALREIGLVPDFSYPGQARGRIAFVHRKLDDGDSYFVVNQSKDTQTIEARFRVSGKVPTLWAAETGTSEPLSYRIEDGATLVPLTLQSEQSAHIVFRDVSDAPSRTYTKLEPTPVATLSGPWNVRFQQGRGAPDRVDLPALAPLNESPVHGIRYFSGIATYERTFSAPKSWRPGKPLWIDLGEAREVAEVWINGKRVGGTWHSPYRLPIGNLAKKGRNALRVRVGNLWVNRLIGDAQPGATKITSTATKTYRADAPLRRSGLIGPVQLLIEPDRSDNAGAAVEAH